MDVIIYDILQKLIKNNAILNKKKCAFQLREILLKRTVDNIAHLRKRLRKKKWWWENQCIHIW